MGIDPVEDVAGGSLSRRTFRGAAWSLTGQGVIAGAALITFVIMSRSVEHAELGEYMLAVVGLAAVQWLALNAYREPVIQAPALTSAMCNAAFWFSAGVAVLLAAVLTGAAWLLRTHGFFATTAACLSVLAAKAFFDTLSSIPLALYYRRLQFSLIAKINMLASVAGLAVSIGLLHAGWGVLAVAAAQSLVSAMVFVLLLLCDKWRPQTRFSMKDLGFLRRYAPHVVLWQGVEALNLYLDRFIVGARLSPQALGVYGFGRRLNDVVIEVLAGAAGNVALPAYSKVQQDSGALKRAYLASVRIVTFAVFPVIGILYGVADELVIAVFGTKWAAAVPIYKCFLLLGGIQTVGILQAALIRSLGRPDLWARYQMLQAAANIAVLILLIDYGIYVLAVAVVLRTYLVWTYAVMMTCRLLKMRMTEYLKMFVRPALCAVLACIVAQSVLHMTYDIPAAVMIAGAMLAAVAVYLGAALITMKSITNDVLALLARQV
jgi:O-antigen/teichoic acid export membrane protein